MDFDSTRIGDGMVVAEPSSNVNQHCARALCLLKKASNCFVFTFVSDDFNKEFLLFFFVLCLPSLTFDTKGLICCEYFCQKKRLG